MHQLKDKDCQGGSKNKSAKCFYKKYKDFKYKVTYILKVNGWRKTYHADTNQRKARVAVLISKSRFQSKETYQ